MKKPKEIVQYCWDKFQEFMKENEYTIGEEKWEKWDREQFFWQAWYDGYCAAIPVEREINMDFIVKRQTEIANKNNDKPSKVIFWEGKENEKK